MTTGEEAVLRLDFEDSFPVLKKWPSSLTAQQREVVEEYLKEHHDQLHRQDGETVRLDISSVPQVCGCWQLKVTTHHANGRLRILELRQVADVTRQPESGRLGLSGGVREGAAVAGRPGVQHVDVSVPTVVAASVTPSSGWVGAYLAACEQLAAALPEEPAGLLRTRLRRLQGLSETSPEEFLLLALAGQLQGLPTDPVLAETADGAALDEALASSAAAIIRWQLSKLRGETVQAASRGRV